MPLAEDLRGTLVVPVPEAEPLVGQLRLEYDPPAPFGIPAHITLLFPFRPAGWLGEERVAELAAFIRAVPAARFALTRVGRFAGQVGRSPGVLFLAPDPAEPFVDLTRQLSARFDLLPYGRASSGGNPHLTVARHEDPAVLDRISEALSPSLPLAFTMREAWLMERDVGGYWHRTETFAFGS
jgi:2'-5' RNA ligase